MSFAAPIFLLALLALPAGAALHALAQRRRRRYAVRFPGTGVAALAAPVAPRWRRHLPAALLAAGAAALALALARPEATVAVPVEQASVVLVTDTSRSMTATDVRPDRLAAARSAAEGFLDEAPEELRVGAVAFSDTARVVQPPTTDHQQVRGALAGLVADGGTATGDGLDAALRALEPDQGGDRRPPAAVVLLSDGKQTAGRDAVAVAQEAGRLKVPVYTVALGTPDGVVDGNLRVPPDPQALAQIAQASGGQAFEASDGDQLTAVYERLGSQLGTREETREITAAFAGAGLLLLGGALVGSVRWLGRLP
jgi:Ca-activated chloride channel family protein